MTTNLMLLMILLPSALLVLAVLAVLVAVHADRRPRLQPPPGSDRPLNQPGWSNW